MTYRLTIQDVRREVKRAIAPFLPLLPPSGAIGSGDVVGPASVTVDGQQAVFNGTTGKIIKASNTREFDSGSITYHTAILNQEFHITGWSTSAGQPPNDLYVEGGESIDDSAKGGDVYVRGGEGSSLGDVYVEATNIYFNGFGIYTTFATRHEGGIETDVVSSITSDAPTSFTDGIAVDDIWENTSGHGIVLHDELIVNISGSDLLTVNDTLSTFATPLHLEQYVDFAEIATPAAPDADHLRVYADDFKGFSFLNVLGSANYNVQLGRDSVFVGRNVTGVQIDAGSVVYASGSSANVPSFALARADSPATMPAVGVVIEDIPDNSFGRAMLVGVIENINTNAFNEGDVLYASPSTAGGYVNTPPTYPNYRQEIGRVLVKGVGNGRLQVRVGAEAYAPYIDHGGLSGLADVADHPGYLTLDGTRAMTGPLDLDAQRLVLDADADTYFRASTDDSIAVVIGNTLCGTWTTSGFGFDKPVDCTSTLTMNGFDLDLNGVKLILDADDDTYLYAAADDLPALYAGGSPIFSATTTGMTMSVPLKMAAQELQLDTDADTSLTADTDDRIDVKVAATDTIQIELDKLHGADHTATPRSLTIRAGNGTLTGAAGGSLTVKGGDGAGAGDAGGNLILKPGNKGGVGGAVGTLDFQSAASISQFQINALGLQLQNALDCNNKTLNNLTKVGLIDAKGDLLVGTANDTWARLAVGANGKTLIADSGETTGTKWAGRTAVFTYGWNTANTATPRYLYGQYPINSAGAGLQYAGYTAPCAGRVRAASIWCDVTTYTSGDIAVGVYYDAVSQGNYAQFTPSGIANNQKSYQVGLDLPFTAGQNITAARMFISGVGITTTFLVVCLWLELEMT